jgi:AAA family ATP:ADP antiporter
VQRLNYTPYTLMFLGACVLMVALSTTLAVNARESKRARPEVADVSRETLGPQGGFELILHDRYLLWIAVLIVLLNVVNTTGGYVLNRLIVGEAAARFGADPSSVVASRQFVTAFSGSISAAVNLVGLLLQLFATSRVIRLMGVRGAMFVLPVIALINYSIIVVAPLLAVVRIGKIIENSTDYSIQNTLRQALFLPTSREAKYKAKAAIDTFFTRTGDVVSAGFVYLGQVVGVTTSAFAAINVLLTILWLGVARQIAKEHRQRTV